MNKLLSHTLLVLITLGFLCQGTVSVLALALAVGQAEVCTTAQTGDDPIVVVVTDGDLSVASQAQGLTDQCNSRPQQPGVNAGLLTLPTLPTQAAQAASIANMTPAAVACSTTELIRLAREGMGHALRFRPMRC